MILSIQIYSLLYSFLYGIIFYFLLEINYKLIYSSKIFIRIIYSFLFLITNTLVYFLVLVKINNGIVHPYFLISLTLGYLLTYYLTKKLFKNSLHNVNKCK